MSTLTFTSLSTRFALWCSCGSLWPWPCLSKTYANCQKVIGFIVAPSVGVHIICELSHATNGWKRIFAKRNECARVWLISPLRKSRVQRLLSTISVSYSIECRNICFCGIILRINQGGERQGGIRRRNFFLCALGHPLFSVYLSLYILEWSLRLDWDWIQWYIQIGPLTMHATSQGS